MYCHVLINLQIMHRVKRIYSSFNEIIVCSDCGLDKLGLGQWTHCEYMRWSTLPSTDKISHYDVITWKRFSHYCPFVRGILRSPVDSPHKGQWFGAFMFPLMPARTDCWTNNREAGEIEIPWRSFDVPALNSSTILCWIIFWTNADLPPPTPNQIIFNETNFR